MATVRQDIDPIGARVFTTVQPPELVQANGTNYPVSGYAFDGAGSTVEAIYFELYAGDYGSSADVVVLVDFYGVTNPGASQNVIWQAAVCARTPGDSQSILTDSFATAVAASAVAVGTSDAGYPKRATITITSTNLDSLASGDRFTLKLFRDPAHASDSYTQDALVYGVAVEWSST